MDASEIRDFISELEVASLPRAHQMIADHAKDLVALKEKGEYKYEHKEVPPTLDLMMWIGVLKERKKPVYEETRELGRLLNIIWGNDQ